MLILSLSPVSCGVGSVSAVVALEGKGPGALVEAAGGVDGVAGRMTVLELRCA